MQRIGGGSDRPPEIPNKLIVGNRGTGKSVLLEWFITQLVCAVLFLDRGTSARRLLGHRSRMGREGQTWYQEARNVAKTIAWPKLTPSSHPDQLQRQIENDATVEDCVQGEFARRMLKDGSLAPYTYKYAVEASHVYLGLLHLDRPPTINMRRRPLAYGDPVGQWMLDNTTAQTHGDEIRRVLALGPRRAEEIMGASYRLLEAEESPTVWGCTGNSFDFEQLILANGHLYLDLRDVPNAHARSRAVSAYTAAIHANQRLFARTNTPHNLVIVCEESGALDLITPILLTAGQEDRKVGTSIWACTQTTEDIKPKESFETLVALCDEHHIFRSNAGLDRLADMVVDSSFRNDEVHYIKTRREQTGNHTEVRTRTHNRVTGETELPNLKKNKSKSETEVEHVHLQPETVEKQEAVYKGVPLVKQEAKVAIRNLPTFHRIDVTRNGVQRAVQKPMEYPWPFSLDRRGNETNLYRERIQEIIHRIQSRPQFIQPQVWRLPTTQI